jgi:hypothetical protein
MAVHDVSRELRGYHGKWTSGGALKRVVDSASTGRRGKELSDRKAAIDELKPGQARGVNGIKVTHMGDKGYRVTMPGETRHYASSHDAARAVHGKAHVEPTGRQAVPGEVLPAGTPRTPTRPVGNKARGEILPPKKEYTEEQWKAAQAEARRKALSAEGGTSPGYYQAAPEHRPYEYTPEAALRDMVTRGGNEAATKELLSRMTAKEKARVEAENAARFGPKRGLQEFGNKMGGVPGSSGIVSDTGYTPGKGVGGRYRGAKSPEYYQRLSIPELENLVRSRGSQAAQDELNKRQRRAGQQSRLAAAASRRGITNRRKMA